MKASLRQSLKNSIHSQISQKFDASQFARESNVKLEFDSHDERLTDLEDRTTSTIVALKSMLTQLKLQNDWL